jgi:hypothetical protein
MDPALAHYFTHDAPGFEYTRDVLTLRAKKEKDWARMPWVALMVSQNYHSDGEVLRWVDKLHEKYGALTLIHGGARGANKLALKHAEELGFTVIEVENHQGNQAIQAQHVLWLADIVACFWTGGSDLVEATIKKALMCHRPDHRFEPGLHVYEMQWQRKTRSNPKPKFTGRVRYRTRKGFKLVEPKVATRAKAA